MGYRAVMTTTPQEPEPQPETVPSGDPGHGAPGPADEHGDAPKSEPDTLPAEDAAATGTDPEDAERTVGPGVAD